MALTITLTTTTLVEIVVAVTVVFGAVYLSKSSSNSTSNSNGKKSKSKKKKNTSTIGVTNGDDINNKVEEKEVLVTPEVGGKKKKVRVNPSTTSTSTSTSTPIPIDSTPSPTPIISSKPTKSTTTSITPSSTSSSKSPSFASITSNSTPTPTIIKKQTAAESHYKLPSPTTVDDMRDIEIDPKVNISRVMRIIDSSAARVGKKGEIGSSRYDEWGDLIEEENDWETAGSKKPTKSPASQASKSAASAFISSNPPPATTRSIPGLPEQMTKKQRENSKKSGKAAADKEDAERLRLDRLANHRRELDRARIMEQEKERNKSKPKNIRSENVTSIRSKSTNGSNGGSKVKEQSGGMSASLDNDGILIWE